MYSLLFGILCGKSGILAYAFYSSSITRLILKQHTKLKTEIPALTGMTLLIVN